MSVCVCLNTHFPSASHNVSACKYLCLFACVCVCLHVYFSQHGSVHSPADTYIHTYILTIPLRGFFSALVSLQDLWNISLAKRRRFTMCISRMAHSPSTARILALSGIDFYVYACVNENRFAVCTCVCNHIIHAML